MGCRPSRNSLSRVADSTCEYNRCYMKEFDKARRKQKKSARQNRRRMPTYNNFSSTSKVYDRTSGTSKITVRLSTDGSMLEIEQFDVEYDSTETAEAEENLNDDPGLVMKSVSELKALHNHGNLYGRSDSAPLLISSSSESACANSKQSGCGLTSCCIQTRSDSRTISEEYKPKSTSTDDFPRVNEVVVEHSCEVHRDYELNAKNSDEKSLDSDSLNSTSHKNMSDSTKMSAENELVSNQTQVCQKATILVKRSSLEQQVKDAYQSGLESHLYYSCSTFKPIAKKELKDQDGSHLKCKSNHNNCCSARSLCQEKYSAAVASGEISRKSPYTNAMTLGVNDLELNKTETFVINNHESRLQNRIAENNQLGINCSACDNYKNISQIGDCTCSSDVGVGCCQNSSFQAYATITQINKQYQSQLCSSCDGETELNMYCGCCFTKHNNYEDNGQQCSRFPQCCNAHLSLDKPDDDKRWVSSGDKSIKGDEVLDIDQDSSIDRHKCTDCGKKTLHSFVCTNGPKRHVPNDGDGDTTSFTTSLNDGKIFQTTYGYNKLDVLHSAQHAKNEIKHGNGITDFVHIRRCHELASQRPCVPNKTITQDLDVQNYSQCLQKSIIVKDNKSENICQENFNINQRIRCFHNDKETLKADNLESVTMVTNEVPRTTLKDDERPCNDMQRTGRTDKNERCNYCDDMTDVVDNDVYHDTCNCRKRSFVIASIGYRPTDYHDDIDGQLINDNDKSGKIDEEKLCSETFPFCEYESFVVRDNRRGHLNDAQKHRETISNGSTSLIGHTIEESSSSVDSISSDDDDEDFDDGSSDECRDEYVDALETTYV